MLAFSIFCCDFVDIFNVLKPTGNLHFSNEFSVHICMCFIYNTDLPIEPGHTKSLMFSAKFAGSIIQTSN